MTEKSSQPLTPARPESQPSKDENLNEAVKIFESMTTGLLSQSDVYSFVSNLINEFLEKHHRELSPGDVEKLVNMRSDLAARSNSIQLRRL